MKTFPYRLEAYWDGIEEPLVAPIARLASFLDDLTAGVPDTSSWFVDEGDGLALLDAQDPVQHLIAVATKSREAWAYGENELSAYPLFLSNARRRAKGVRVTFKCGHRRSDVGIWFADRVVIDLWAPREGFEELPQLVAVFDAMCRTFQPLWACAGPPNWPVRALPDELTGVPKVSWLAYLRASTEPTLVAAGVAPDSIGTSDGAPGRRVLAVDDWFDVTDAQHVERVDKFREQLTSAGALTARTRPPE